jgi:putative flippase GtrA
MEKLLKKHAEKLRFAVVGGANTALDFALLFILVFAGLDKIAANFISTATAFVFSYFVNKSFTFKSTSSGKRQFILFIIITAFGLWVIQPVIITVIAWVMSGTGVNDQIILLIGKLIATVATMVWNYVLYSRYVFKKAN